ncbi:MAG: CoA-transferase [Pseudomonadota bacterium]
MTLDKRMTPTEMVGEISNGMTIGIGGWGPRRKPMVLVREILRSDLRDLTVVTYGGPDAGMLCAAGKVKKLVFAFVSLDAIPLEPWFRYAREKVGVEVLELDEGLLQWGLQAAAFGLPFLPTKVGLGTDVHKLGGFETVQSPYEDGEVLLAMPALRLDVALLHVNRADWRGNVQAFGPDTFYDQWYARAADRAFVSSELLVERIEDDFVDDAQANIFERCFVTGVMEARYGAHPTYMAPDYGWDMDHLKAYGAAAKEEGGWEKWMADMIGDDEAGYLARNGGEEAISKLPLPVF